MTMLYLLEKYAPELQGVDRYDSTKDFLLTGEALAPHREHVCHGETRQKL